MSNEEKNEILDAIAARQAKLKEEKEEKSIPKPKKEKKSTIPEYILESLKIIILSNRKRYLHSKSTGMKALLDQVEAYFFQEGDK